MASAIATLDELKSYVDVTRSGDDDLLQAILDGVSERVERYTGRVLHPIPALDGSGDDTGSPVTKTVTLPRRLMRWTPARDPLRPRTRIIEVPDVREIETGGVTGVAAAITGYEPLGDGPPWDRIQVFGLTIPAQDPVTALPAIQITGRFGMWPAPADLKDAVLVMSARRWRERDASYGDSVQLAEGVTVSYFKQFPATVQATIQSYTRPVLALP